MASEGWVESGKVEMREESLDEVAARNPENIGAGVWLRMGDTQPSPVHSSDGQTEGLGVSPTSKAEPLCFPGLD